MTIDPQSSRNVHRQTGSTKSIGFIRLALAAVFLAAPTASLLAQEAPAAATSTPGPVPSSDRAASYYHFGLAHMYEDLATST